MQPNDWTQLRRSEYAMPDERAIEAFLGQAPFGYLATSLGDQPFLHVSLFWFDAAHRRIYIHGARAGRTPENLERNPRVCFSVAEIGRLIPAAVASDFENEYASVIVFGRARQVDDPTEKQAALQALLDKHFPELHPGSDYRPITDDERARTNVYAIEIEAWSGKERRVAE
jgi:nitroimidazol reductase NimA-like FMN-containing flavoprotein (pyridoxamine 5'-phosphate oxidase superfamily)